MDDDGIGRLTDVTHAKGANTLASYSYTFDAASRITSVTSTDGTSTYSYDATSQLTAADHSYQTDESYTYNHTGGRTDTDYDTTTNNRLATDGTHTYQYDDNGNRTRRTVIATGDYVQYEWDHRNRLVAVEFRTSTGTLTKAVEFDYDMFDRLIAKRVDDQGDGIFDRAQKFVYDGLSAVLVFDDSGALTDRMLYGPATDQFFADEDALGEVLWGLTDHLGTVRDVAEYDSGTDTTSVVNHIKYDSFGNVTSESNASASPLLKFTGRYFDEDIGLQWNWKRWYDPSTGLWISEDPIGFTGGDTNLVRYAFNAPTLYTDPSGLEVEIMYREIKYASTFLQILSGPVYLYTGEEATINHAILVFTPDVPADFNNVPRFTLSANPGRDRGDDAPPPAAPPTDWGWLISEYDYPKDQPQDPGPWAEPTNVRPGYIVPRPPRYQNDPNDTRFIRDIIEADRRYNDDAPYAPDPAIPNETIGGTFVIRPVPGPSAPRVYPTYNSNSYVSGMLAAVGARRPPRLDPDDFPGWNQPLPIPYPRPPRRPQ